MAVVSVIANIVLAVLLMGPLGHGGLALSTSLASMLNLVLLIRALRVTLGSLELKNIKESVCKTLVSSAMMGAVVWAVSVYMIRSGDETSSSLLVGLMGSIIIGFLFYGAFSFLIKSPELKKVWVAVTKGVRKIVSTALKKFFFCLSLWLLFNLFLVIIFSDKGLLSSSS